MRKKKIIEQNALLFEQIEKLKHQISELEGKLADADAKIEKLTEENEKQAAAAATESTPLEKIEEKVILAAQFNAADYGAGAIGKIVLAASRVTSSLSGDNAAEKIELVNLILGKAEVSKAEILDAVSSDKTDKEKKMRIDSIVNKTTEYFDKAANGG